MSHVPRSMKGPMGAVLLQLYDGREVDDGLAEELAYVLVDKGLTEFHPSYSPRAQASGRRAHFTLTGTGKQLVLTYTRYQLVAGRFLLPGESPWYDRWPWKLVWPAVLSVVASLTAVVVKDQLFHAPPTSASTQSVSTELPPSAN